jgi:hypothetical protein
MEGSPTATCVLAWNVDQVELTWTHLPHCYPTCVPPPSIHNGSISGGGASRDVNSTVTYACNMPYVTSGGSENLTCVVDSEGVPQWQPAQPPTCAVPTCSSRPITFTRDSWALVNPSYPATSVQRGVHCNWLVQVRVWFFFFASPYAFNLFKILNG